MVALSKSIKEVEKRLTRLVNEAINYKFGGRNRYIHPADLIIDPFAGFQTYYFRDEAVYNKGPWKDFVDYRVEGRLAPNTTPEELYQKVDRAVIDGNIIVKLVDTPGQLIDWDNLREWHYHPPGDNFNDEFVQPYPQRRGDENFRILVCIYSKGDCDEIMGRY